MACSGKDAGTTDTGTETTEPEPAYGVTVTEPEYGATITTPPSTGDTGATYSSGSGTTSGVDYGSPYTYGGSGS
jgi:hypothetical protein